MECRIQSKVWHGMAVDGVALSVPLTGLDRPWRRDSREPTVRARARNGCAWADGTMAVRMFHGLGILALGPAQGGQPTEGSYKDRNGWLVGQKQR